MGLSVWQIVLVILLFLLLFGRGKIPALMGDLAAGIKSFKHGMKEDQDADFSAQHSPQPTHSTNNSPDKVLDKAVASTSDVKEKTTTS